MLALLLFRFRRFIFEFFFPIADYLRFKKSVQKNIGKLEQAFGNQDEKPLPHLLLVAGLNMNISWLQLWSILGAVQQKGGGEVTVLTSKSNFIQNLYMKLFNFHLIYLENCDIEPVKADYLDKIRKLESYDDFKFFEYDEVPFGKIALSTYGRHHATGQISVAEPGIAEALRDWMEFLMGAYQMAHRLYAEKNIEILYFTEVFMEEYGAFYYAALNRNLNIIRFAGTVRDDSVVVQHLTKQSDRTHFSSLSDASWEKVKQIPHDDIGPFIEKNFADRYGSKWGLSSRNQLHTKIMHPEAVRQKLKLSEKEKIAVIYSHILYDTLFFNGEDLFQDYAEWLVETVRAACRNDKLRWFIKIHPSNLWRGELESFLDGKYEEVRILENSLGQLPPHVQFIYPDTDISPYSWLQVADFGITARGTSGIELGAFGKGVITAGTGRYENRGFTFDSTHKDDYLHKLEQLPDIKMDKKAVQKNGEYFAFATFVLKPFQLSFLSPCIRFGKKMIYATEDLVYRFRLENPEAIEAVKKLHSWTLKKEQIDLLTGWPDEMNKTNVD